MDLVGDMDDILSFVEDVDGLKDKLKRFTSTIEQILLTIDKCCSLMKKYLEADLAGMRLDVIHSNILTNLSGRTWKAFVEAEQVNNFKTELASLSTKLNGATVVHIAHVTETVSSGGKSIFENGHYEFTDGIIKQNYSFSDRS